MANPRCPLCSCLTELMARDVDGDGGNRYRCGSCDHVFVDWTDA